MIGRINQNTLKGLNFDLRSASKPSEPIMAEIIGSRATILVFELNLRTGNLPKKVLMPNSPNEIANININVINEKTPSLRYFLFKRENGDNKSDRKPVYIAVSLKFDGQMKFLYIGLPQPIVPQNRNNVSGWNLLSPAPSLYPNPM